MLTYNETNAGFPLSLDGRGARGEGALRESRSLAALLLVGAWLFAPQAALAQNECGVQAGDTVTCSPGDYSGGITYDSLGDLTLEVPDGTVDFRLLDDGVSVTGIGADNVFWDSSAFVSQDILGDASDPDNNPGTFDGAVLNYLSDTGDVDILIGGRIKGLDSASHAIRAESTGGGNVSVMTQDDVNFRPPGSSTAPNQAAGIGIEALTTSGNISLDVERVNSGRTGGLYAIHTASSAGGSIDISAGNVSGIGGGSGQNNGEATHGILAETTGAGNITINAGSVTVSTFNNPNAFAAVEAVTGTGDIVVNASLTGPIGLLAETGGAGTITADGIGDSVIATTETGAITATGIQGGSVLMSQTGNITASMTGASGSGGGTALTTQTDGSTTVDLAGSYSPWAGGPSNLRSTVFITVQSSGAGSVAVDVAGDPDVVIDPGDPNVRNDGFLMNDLRSIVAAPFDFSGLGGNATVNFNGGSGWVLQDPGGIETAGGFDPIASIAPRNVLSGGDDIVNIAANAAVSTPFFGTAFADVGPGFAGREEAFLSRPAEDFRYVAHFGGGDDVLDMAGHLFVAPLVSSLNTARLDAYAGEMRLEGLETFNSSGEIWLGVLFGVLGGTTNEFQEKTDGRTDDILSLPGTHFVGEVDADGRALTRIYADVKLGAAGQTSGCGIEHRPADKVLPVVDCIDLRGGHATGRTLFLLNQDIPGDRGAFNGEGSVLVDVSGDNADQTDPQAFALSPENLQYTELPDGTGVIDKGLFFYTIAYDPADEQYKLYGLPGSGAQQFPLLGQAANGLWRTATNAWFDRRVDQRDVEADAGTGSGAWFRVSRESGDRDLITPIIGGGTTFAFDNGYSEDKTAVTVGGDLISRGAGDTAWLVGGMIGYARGELDYDASRNSAELRGMHAGLYASMTWNDFYVDMAANGTWMDIYNDVPALNLSPAGTVLDTEVDSLGAQIEAGWRLRLGRLSVEPIAGFTYVRSEFDDMSVPADDPDRFGALVTFDTPTSQRGSLGVRLRMDDLAPGIVPVSVGLTTRAIEEFDGESTVNVVNTGPTDAPVIDTFDGTFVNVAGDVSITNAAKTIAGFVKVDGTFHDDYDSVGVSAGLRYQW